MLRKEGNVHVLDFFVNVPPGAAAQIKYKPLEVDAINQVADGREHRKRVTLDCSKPIFLMAGGVTVEDRSKRTETVRPQFGERCNSRSECNSALNVKSDWNDIELNGETDHEDMGDGATAFDDGSAQVRNRRDPGQLTAHEHQELITYATAGRPFRGARSPPLRSVFSSKDSHLRFLHSRHFFLAIKFMYASTGRASLSSAELSHSRKTMNAA